MIPAPYPSDVDLELTFNDLEEDGPFSHIVCDLRFPLQEDELTPLNLQRYAQALLLALGAPLATWEMDALVHAVRYTKRMSFLEQGELPAKLIA